MTAEVHQKLRQKSILAVMDISGVGRCSALVVVPVLSLSGCSCAFLPTAYFSTHTGGFGAVHRLDMKGDMEQALAQYKRLGLRFDAVYIGYAASEDHLRILEEALSDLLMPHGKLYLDPVMGDHGRRYAFCGEELIEGYRRLCRKADVIFPNRTEAALLLDLSISENTEPEVPDVQSLRTLGAGNVIITGVSSPEGEIGVLAVPQTSAPFSVFRPKYPGSFPGAGDLLAAGVIASLMKGAQLEHACEIACDFLDASLRATAMFDSEPRFGLAFEKAIPGLCMALEEL